MRELCEAAFAHLGLDWQRHVKVDPAPVRPAEVDVLLADPGKARRQLAWRPTVGFGALVRMMVDADMARLA